MPDRTNRLHRDAAENGVGLPHAPAHGFAWKTWQVLKVVQARLRFFAILAAIAVVIGFWDTLTAYYDKWTRPLYGREATVGGDVEWFCPMHPSVVRDNPKEKCPICHMDLAKRKKGGGQLEPLAPGTVSRVQLSPYRVVLAGVQTVEARYLPLTREVVAFGSVEFNETTQAHIATRQKGRIVKLFVNYTGQMVEKGEKLARIDVRYSQELMETLQNLQRARQRGDHAAEDMHRQRLRVYDVGDDEIQQFLRTGKVNTELTIVSPIHGHIIKKYQREGNFVEEGTPLYDVADLDSVWIQGLVYEADQSLVEEGMPVRATSEALPGRVFSGSLAFVYPHLDEASRTLAVRFNIPNPGHRLRPGMYATVRVEVPPRRIDVLERSLGQEWAALNTTDLLAHTLAAPGGVTPGFGLPSLLRAAGQQTLLQRGLVLAVPDNAIIDTGSLKIVYRESAPNTFEGVAVRLGPRLTEPGSSAALFPVLSGLKAGDKIVTQGSFLIDAETRLNPAAGSIYFGGSKTASSTAAMRPSTPEDEDSKARKARLELAQLGAEDRRLAESQKFCAIQQSNLLGSMGAPIKILLEGQPVFLCCESCKTKAESDPRKTLETVERFKQGKTAPPEPSPSVDAKEAKIQAALAKLTPEDRKLAEAQRYCVIESENRLGSMNTPIKVMVNGQPVFLCCGGCRDDALADPAKTLQQVEKLKAKNAAESHRHH
jgi:Cu(I)/Ag(I) efflux system membrane fusion protein